MSSIIISFLSLEEPGGIYILGIQMLQKIAVYPEKNIVIKFNG